ncbi:MAG: metal-dependent hydrolase [Gammaproteobacteria bacterium]|jgi:inner membrane protein|nr:metal-dependent hydrolase [Gammaproteobacteria bacterium]MBT4493883.1 metal-dependent hydrolase [Gammaproteobacteria bacterium]MBT7369939.1 metal-dependent hydrolase [Gammaproteobacteria bacterium]
MDPISQGSLGAMLAQSASSKEKVKSATLLGCFGGLAPDLDILIVSPTDPLLFLEFHRQFTHSLIFIPIGALIVTLVMYRWLGKGLTFRESYICCLLGYATHGLLDACTNYGTQLFWPFSTERFAWNNVSIVDPLFTLPILGLIVFGVIRKKPALGRIAMLWAVSYLIFGVFQRERAEELGYALAASRDHDPVRLEAKPGFGSMLLWKIVYEAGDRYYVDAVRLGVNGRQYPGDNAEKLDLKKHLPWLDLTSQQAKDIERFRWFSNDYLAVDPDVPNRIIDVRYSVVPNEIDALWAIDLDPHKPQDAHIDWQSLRQTTRDQTARWWQMLLDP